MTCSIKDCDRPVHARNWCGAHYWRWRKHGDPLAGRTPMGKAMSFFHDVVMAYDGSDCLQWPFARDGNGYGRVKREGRMVGVPRLVCEEERGPPPTFEHEAAHSCGKGHEGCVNRHHLSWKTVIENKADMIGHGTRIRGERHRKAKLTEADVLEIRSIRDRLSRREIAEKFGIGIAQVRRIITAESWGWL